MPERGRPDVVQCPFPDGLVPQILRSGSPETEIAAVTVVEAATRMATIWSTPPGGEPSQAVRSERRIDAECGELPRGPMRRPDHAGARQDARGIETRGNPVTDSRLSEGILVGTADH